MKSTALRSLIAAAVLGSAGLSAAQAADAPLLNTSFSAISGVNNGDSSAINIGNFSGNDLYVRATFNLGNLTPDGDASTTANNWPDFVGVWFDNSLTAGAALHTDVPNIGILGSNTAGDAMIRLNSSATSVFTGSVLSAGQSFTILAHLYKAAGSSTYNMLEGWFNPDASAGSTPSSFSVSLANNTGIGSISYIGVRSNLGNSDVVSLSNLSVGTTLASVTAVPEASTLSMLLAGLGMMGFIARRRIKA